MTLSIRYLVDAGNTKPLARLTIIRRKLPPRSRRRGLTSFQISGSTFFSFGLGRLAVRSAAMARPVPREGRSADRMPVEPKEAERNGEAIYLVYSLPLPGAAVPTRASADA